jgi:ribosomal protein L11 methyltransferase
MVDTASLVCSEAEALRLVDALGIAESLAGLAVDVTEEVPGRWRVLVYLDAPPDDRLRAGLAEAARTALGANPPDFAFTELADTDWVAKSLEGLTPVRVGRFLVHGSHDRAKPRPNDLAIEIEAGQAFGTGHHGTTAGCLAAIDRLAKTRPIRNALDVGTGSGVLAIAIAKRCKAPVLASDIDPVAARIADENVRLNGVRPLVRTVCAAGIEGRAFARPDGFDLIVANILAGPLVALAPSIRRRLAPGGAVILSGLLAHQRSRVAAAYRAQGLRLIRAETREGWATLTFARAGAAGG